MDDARRKASGNLEKLAPILPKELVWAITNDLLTLVVVFRCIGILTKDE